MRHLITMADLTSVEVDHIFSITEDLKTKLGQGLREPLLPGRVMAMLFEKKSLRTRVSFQTGMAHLGGTAMFLGDDVGFGKRESMADFGAVNAVYEKAFEAPYPARSCIEVSGLPKGAPIEIEAIARLP